MVLQNVWWMICSFLRHPPSFSLASSKQSKDFTPFYHSLLHITKFSLLSFRRPVVSSSNSLFWYIFEVKKTHSTLLFTSTLLHPSSLSLPCFLYLCLSALSTSFWNLSKQPSNFSFFSDVLYRADTSSLTLIIFCIPLFRCITSYLYCSCIHIYR